MTNPFQSRTPSLQGPALDIVPVTPDDGADLAETGIGFYATSAGNVSVDTITGATRLVPVDAFMIVPLGVTRVRDTDTTATGIHVFTVS